MDGSWHESNMGYDIGRRKLIKKWDYSKINIDITDPDLDPSGKPKMRHLASLLRSRNFV